jgi:hypothetical protein
MTAAEALNFVLTLLASLISHQPAVFFSHNEPANSNQPAVFFSQNKPAPAISHQPTEQAELGNCYACCRVMIVTPSEN